MLGAAPRGQAWQIHARLLESHAHTELALPLAGTSHGLPAGSSCWADSVPAQAAQGWCCSLMSRGKGQKRREAAYNRAHQVWCPRILF